MKLLFNYIVAIIGFVLISYSSIIPQMRTSIEDIINNPKDYENSEIVIEGIVTQYTQGKGTTNYYLVKGDFGGIIKVNTAQPEPKINAKYRVIGIVYRDASTREAFISEKTKELLLDKGFFNVDVSPSDAIVKLNGQMLNGEGPWEVSVGTYNLEVSKDGYETDRRTVSIIAEQTTSESVQLSEIGFWSELSDNIILLVVIIIIVILIIVLLISLLRRNKVTSYEPESAIGSEPGTAEFKAPPPVFTSEQEFKTIKITKSSPPKTLKFIPGKLVITDGPDKGKELKIAGYSSPEGSIVSIGRKEVTGEKAYAHIHLKENTVSREQAELIHKDGKVYIKNLSQTNFTQLNGEELTPGQMKELTPGSKIRTGEVEFKYQLN